MILRCMLNRNHLAVAFIVLSTVCWSADAIYCGDDDCYDLLGVKHDATLQDIKKSYRNISRTLHPDKNPAPEAQQLFQKIAAAYEILNHPKTRKAYDYALAHPEEHMYNRYQFYNAKYEKYWRTDVRFVFLGFIGVVSFIQYAAKHINYTKAMTAIRATPRYKHLLKRLQQEREAAAAVAPGSGTDRLRQRRKATGRAGVSKKDRTGGAAEAQEEQRELVAAADAEVAVHGVPKPRLRDTLVVQLVFLPLTAYRDLLVGDELTEFTGGPALSLAERAAMWAGHWLVHYTIRGEPYDEAAQAYLTRRAMHFTQSYWDGLTPEAQGEWLRKELWIRENLERESRAQAARSMKRALRRGWEPSFGDD